VAWARVPPPQGGFADDPHAPLVYALEEFDEETNTATKAEIFTHRVTAPRQAPERAGTPEEAAAISLDLYGEVRLDAVARLLGLPDEQAARTALGTVVFTEPHTMRLVPAAEYLSGNVRIKLAQPRDGADIDAAFAVNVQALTEVQPTHVPPDKIRVKLGAPWVGAPYVQEFLRELLRDESMTVERAAGSTWTVNCSTERNVMTTKVWGTEEMPAVQIIRALLNQKPIRITPDFPEEATAAEKARLRAEAMTATTIANKYADRINDEFRTWLWRDEERAETLADLCVHRPWARGSAVRPAGPAARVGRHPRGHAGGVESAPIVVHGRSLSGGRRVTVHRHGGEQVLGTAYSDHDLVVFLESTGIPDPESVLDDPRWVQWRDDPAHDFAAA
ncbi:hypothetical protein, partial [Streptomyces flaveolus]|uniref:hypothetical protein n=1 Tax=Streptomyces flaveolus TaxID=67297 RepID=UPI003345E6CD